MNFIRAQLLIALMSLSSLVGCMGSATHARINDVSVPQAFDSGYRVVAVDDAPAIRASNPAATMVPVVNVGPGSRTFTLKSATGTEQKITATVEAGKEYRIAMKDGTPVMVEHGK